MKFCLNIIWRVTVGYSNVFLMTLETYNYASED